MNTNFKERNSRDASTEEHGTIGVFSLVGKVKVVGIMLATFSAPALLGCGNFSRVVAPDGLGVSEQPALTAPEETKTISADAWFEFDYASIESITESGRAQLDHLIHRLMIQSGNVESVRVFGYTDRIGSKDYNSGLSTRRAQVVMDYLVDHDIPASLINVQGRGASDPVKDCPDMPKKALIACLAPNRRVVIKVDISDM